MAVTPREAAKINDASERKALKEMEAHIDGCLNKSFRTGMTVSIGAGELIKAAGVGYSKRAWEEVKRRFEAVGWRIKKMSNKGNYNRSSDSFVFSAAPTPVNSPREQGSLAPWHEADNTGKLKESQR